MTSPIERLRNGYAQSQPHPDRRSRDEKLAVGYRPNEQMERLLSMSEAERAEVLSAHPDLRQQLAYYTSAKSAQEATR